MARATSDVAAEFARCEFRSGAEPACDRTGVLRATGSGPRSEHYGRLTSTTLCPECLSKKSSASFIHESSPLCVCCATSLTTCWRCRSHANSARVVAGQTASSHSSQ